MGLLQVRDLCALSRWVVVVALIPEELILLRLSTPRKMDITSRDFHGKLTNFSPSPRGDVFSDMRLSRHESESDRDKDCQSLKGGPRCHRHFNCFVRSGVSAD